MRGSPSWSGLSEAEVRKRRAALGVRPVFKRIDTCAAEFASPTAYMYSTYERGLFGELPLTKPRPSSRDKVIILGGGPNRIGQGIEFDYCCCHACFALSQGGHRDHHGQLQSRDRLDRLRHLRPALFRAADGRGRAGDHPRRAVEGTLEGRHRAVRRPDAAQACQPLEEAGVPILGTSPDAIDLAEDRDRFKRADRAAAAEAAGERHCPHARRRHARSPTASAIPW